MLEDIGDFIIRVTINLFIALIVLCIAALVLGLILVIFAAVIFPVFGWLGVVVGGGLVGYMRIKYGWFSAYAQHPDMDTWNDDHVYECYSREDMNNKMGREKQFGLGLEAIARVILGSDDV